MNAKSIKGGASSPGLNIWRNLKILRDHLRGGGSSRPVLLIFGRMIPGLFILAIEILMWMPRAAASRHFPRDGDPKLKSDIDRDMHTQVTGFFAPAFVYNPRQVEAHVEVPLDIPA